MIEVKTRDVTVEDAEKIHEIYVPYVKNTAISMEITAPTVENMRKRIENTIKDNFPYIVATDENENIIGYAYAGKYNEREGFKYSCILSIYLNENFHSNGIGQLLYNEVEERLKKRGIVNIVSVISNINEKSINFHKKNGFEEIGYFKNAAYKFDKWYDMLTFNKIINIPKGK